MMYDTSLRFQKPYQHLMASWTREVLEWSGTTDVLLGLPAYDDPGVKYHYPHVENLKNSLLGIHDKSYYFDLFSGIHHRYVRHILYDRYGNMAAHRCV
jgi:hypothetical protein